MTADSRCASVPSVQPDEVRREPAGDDQLSHGTLLSPTPCETGCVFFASVFSSPFTAVGRRGSAGLTLCSSSSTVTGLLLLLGKAAAGRERGNGSVFRWPSAGGGKMSEHLQKCHGGFERDDHALTAFLVLLSETNGRFPEASSTFYGEICTLIVVDFLWRSCDLIFLRWNRGSVGPHLERSHSCHKYAEACQALNEVPNPSNICCTVLDKF